MLTVGFALHVTAFRADNTKRGSYANKASSIKANLILILTYFADAGGIVKKGVFFCLLAKSNDDLTNPEAGKIIWYKKKPACGPVFEYCEFLGYFSLKPNMMATQPLPA